MQTDRRKVKRSSGDEFIAQTLMTLRSIEKLSRGEYVDYTEHYADLVAIKDRLGRRKEDHVLGELMCVTLEGIASNLENLMRKEKTPRLVKITKGSRDKTSQISVHISVGWESERPRVGKHYRLYKNDGSTFTSALVTDVTSDFFQTQNSLYRVETLQ